MDIDSQKYPIGKYKSPKTIEIHHLVAWKHTISKFPENITELVSGLSDDEKKWKYRPGGWNIAQIVHHCADSHMNAYVRFKLTATENIPTVKPYEEDLWAELIDAKDLNLDSSLNILTGIHKRWHQMMKNLSFEEFNRKLFHPEMKKAIPLKFMLGMYDWHCRHHLKHIENALASKGKFNEK